MSGPIQMKGFRPNKLPKPGGGIYTPGGQVARPSIVLDAMGRPLSVGDRIQVEVGHPHLFEVVKIEPIVDPQVPAEVVDNNMVIVVRAVIRFFAAKGQPSQEFLRVAEAAEFGQPAAPPEPRDEPPPADQPTDAVDPDAETSEDIGDPPEGETEIER